MSPNRRGGSKGQGISQARLAEMIEEAIVDAYGEHEQNIGWSAKMDEHLRVPFVTMVLGVEVIVERVHTSEGEQIIAICKRGRVRQGRSPFWICRCRRICPKARSGLRPIASGEAR